ncbi:GPI-anchored small secreted protein [Mycena belliarum]|uniref:GPI-anchored small secreted protein n=1 Tax=Mycena belliarum TaxID=1033014 RepID=A0AAD6UD54_9AGAR|nr:GPI-anchored small secreted protein [Mycena belliae]
MFSLLAILAVSLLSASAIQVTSPGGTKGWTNDGSQSIAWQSVSTDPSNFTIVLTNPNRALMPNDNQILKALVSTNAGSTTVDPPAMGWPAVGGSYRVNLCKSSEDLNSILAQSMEFNITAAAVKSGASSATAATTATSPTDSGTASGDAPAPSKSNAAFQIGAPTGFVGALVLLCGMLA